MKNRLPVYIENRDLPIDKYGNIEDSNNSFGYVNILLVYVVTIIVSLVTIILLGNR